MIGLKVKGTVVVTMVMLLGTTLTACSAGTSSAGGQASAQSGESAEPAEAPAPADLTGEWVQTNSKSEDSYQAATITGDTVEVNWVSDGGSTTALYWAGSFEAPTVAGAHSWDSVNDTEKTASALMASGDETKTFNYEDDVISYEVTAMGVTVTVELERQ